MIRKSLLLLALLLASWIVSAQSYLFKHLEVSDGLSNNSVNTIYKDRDGFMWFGTTTGLNRYDGYTFKIYQHAENEPGSLPDNYITDIVEMPDGRFWINTARGYVLFDKERDYFITDVTGFMKNLESWGVPEQVFVDREGNTWLSVAGEGCYRYKEGGKRLFFSYTEHSLPEYGVTQMAECSDGILLIYNTGLLVCLDRATLAIKWQSDEIKKYIPGGKTIELSLFVDRDNCIWAYSLMGIWAYDCGTKSWRTDLTGIWSSRPDVIIHAVAQDIEGRIWVGKDYDGIDVLEKETGKVTSLVAHDDNGRSLPHNTIYDLYADRDGVMWVGTYKKGVSYYSESIFKFNMYEWGDITCIEQADEDRLWLGTNDHGILLWNRSTGKAEPFWRDAEGQLPNPVVSMLKSKDGKLWVGTFNGGLYCMNGSQVRSYKEGTGNALASNNVWALVEDDKGRIWIASLGGGLQCLEPLSGTFETYTSNNSALLENNVTSLCWVDDNTLFFGTASQGVGTMDMRTREIKKIQGQSDSMKLSNDAVNHVYKDSRGLVWIATREGLNVYDTRRHMFLDLFPVAEAKGNFIAAITEDQERNMWVSTSRKVIRVTVASDGKGSYLFDSRAYNSEDGLQNCDFNQRSIKTLHNGIIAIGGLYGVNVFAPDHIRYNKMLPNVMFTGLSLFDEAVKVGLASTVSFMIGNFITGFLVAAQPQLVKFYGEGDMEKFNRLIFNTTQYTLFLIAIVMGPVLLEIDYVVDLWLNGNVPPYTTAFIKITMILTLVYRSNSMVETGIQASGYVKLLNLSSVPVYLIVLPIVYFTLKMGWGPVAAIWLANIAPVVTFLINLVIIQRTIHFPSRCFFFTCFLRTIGLVLISLLLPYWVQQQMGESLLRFLIVCALSVFCTFSMIWFWGFNEDVRNMARKKIVGKFFHK